jgi:hypothetical protein
MKHEFKVQDQDKELIQLQNRLKELMATNIAAKRLPSTRYITSDLDKLDQLRNTVKKNAREEFVKETGNPKKKRKTK